MQSHRTHFESFGETFPMSHLFEKILLLSSYDLYLLMKGKAHIRGFLSCHSILFLYFNELQKEPFSAENVPSKSRQTFLRLET